MLFWMDLVSLLLHPVHPRPTVPWDGVDRLGSYQSVSPVLTVHPIPLYHEMEWTDVPKCPSCPHCPSHPTVLWDAHSIGSKCIFTRSKKSCSYVYLLSQIIMTLLRHVDCSLVGCQSLESMLLILRLHHGLVGCKQLDINRA